MFTRDDLLRALESCVVPSLHRDVLQANLVRAATVELDRGAPGAGIRGVPERYAVRVELTAPGGEEVINAQLRAAVENRLLGMPEISRAEVTMTPPLFPILNAG